MLIALLYLLGISLAELGIAYFSPSLGIAVHAFIFVGLFVHATLTSHHPSHKFYLSLALVPLLRILSVSMPLARFPLIYWFIITSLPLIIAIFMVLRLLRLPWREIGLTSSLKWVPPHLLLGGAGFLLGFVEYNILKPLPLMHSLSWERMIIPSLVLLVGTGFAEEFLFRGLLQQTSEGVMGRWGILYVSVMFAMLHVGYLSAWEVFFVFGVGLLFALAVKRTGSLWGVTLCHGAINIGLYLVFPFIFASPVPPLFA